MHNSNETDTAGPAQEREMPRYVSHKTVWALEIDEVGPAPGRSLKFREKGYGPIRVADEMFTRYTPVPGDFYVVYADGYKSFLLRKAFLEGYTREPVGRQA